MHHADNNDVASRDPEPATEIAGLVDLCASQIMTAVDEALGECDALSGSVLDAARLTSELLGESNSADERLKADAQALQQAVQDASLRLQFIDRLNQRLSNVSSNLAGLAEFMQSADLPISEIAWSRFLEETRETFTMTQERQMFDALFRDPTATSGAELAMNASQDITLFDGDAGDDE